MGRLMHISQHRQAGIFGQSGQDARALDDSRPAITLDAGAVGLVVAGLEDERNAEFRRDALDALGHRTHVRLGLNHARSGDQKQPSPANLHWSNLK